MGSITSTLASFHPSLSQPPRPPVDVIVDHHTLQQRFPNISLSPILDILSTANHTQPARHVRPHIVSLSERPTHISTTDLHWTRLPEHPTTADDVNATMAHLLGVLSSKSGDHPCIALVVASPPCIIVPAILAFMAGCDIELWVISNDHCMGEHGRWISNIESTHVHNAHADSTRAMLRLYSLSTVLQDSNCDTSSSDQEIRHNCLKRAFNVELDPSMHQPAKRQRSI